MVRHLCEIEHRHQSVEQTCHNSPMARSAPDLPSQLGPNLRALRSNQERTLRDLEKVTGLTSGYLSQLERGEVGYPSPTVLRKLALGYGIDPLILLQWAGYVADERLELSPNQAAALSTIGDPSTEELRALQGIVEYLRSKGSAPNLPGSTVPIVLDSVSREEISGYARALLLEADAFGERPTPLDTLQSAAELVRAEELQLTPTDKAKLTSRLGRWVEIGWRRLRGSMDFRTRTIWIKPDLHPAARPFTVAHEIGHAILPAHEDFYVDTWNSLQPTFRSLLEQEANFAATQLLFQCGQMVEEGDSSPIGLAEICALADRFGASIISTARHFAECSKHDVALAVAHHPRAAMGPTYLYTSAGFEKRFCWRSGRAPADALRQTLVSASSGVATEEWDLLDADGQDETVRVESLHTTWAALALVVRDRSYRRAGRRLIDAVRS